MSDSSEAVEVRAVRTVVSLVDDLFFHVKIADAVKRAGCESVFVKTRDAAIERLRSQTVLLLLLDLNFSAASPISFISEVKSGPFAGVPVVAYVSHVNAELKRQALDAGCDLVLARSAFDSKFPQILHDRAGRS